MGERNGKKVSGSKNFHYSNKSLKHGIKMWENFVNELGNVRRAVPRGYNLNDSENQTSSVPVLCHDLG